MLFNPVVLCVILAGAAFAAPVQETFESNRESILAATTSSVGDWVFAVGRAKQTLRASDEVGFSKAAALAYANLDLLNFKNAQWPASADADERKAAWTIYRGRHPFTLTVEGGQRVWSSKTDSDKYLVVLAFPRARVFMDAPRREDLEAALAQYREELKRMTEKIAGVSAASSATNRLDVRKTQVESRKDASVGVVKSESFDAGLML